MHRAGDGAGGSWRGKRPRNRWPPWTREALHRAGDGETIEAGTARATGTGASWRGQRHRHRGPPWTQEARHRAGTARATGGASMSASDVEAGTGKLSPGPPAGDTRKAPQPAALGSPQGH